MQRTTEILVLLTSLHFGDRAHAQRVDNTPDTPQPTPQAKSSNSGPSHNVQASLTGNFLQRLGEAYMTGWRADPNTAATPPPLRRGYPAPLDSPPFPGGDFSVGGTPIIGAPDTSTYILMQALNNNRTHTKVYGRLNGGFNVSTSDKGDGANSPPARYYNTNRVTPDQEVLYVERLPNTVQTDHVDWGFRFAQLFGQDYRYTTSKGVFSSQLLKHNHGYGYDPVVFYVDPYIPNVREPATRSNTASTRSVMVAGLARRSCSARSCASSIHTSSRPMTTAPGRRSFIVAGDITYHF